MISKFLKHANARYTLAHRCKLKPHFTFGLEFHAVKPENEEMKTEKRGVRDPPSIGNHDLILAITPDAEADDVEYKHMLCVVDSVVDNLVILKIVLQPLDQKLCDERNFNIYKFMKKEMAT